MAIRKQTLGEKHPLYAATLNNLAVLHLGLGDPGQAEALYRQALDIYKQAYGEDHPQYAAELYNLASLYVGQRDHAKALPLRSQAMQITRQHLDLVAMLQTESQQVRMVASLRPHLDHSIGILAEAKIAGETPYDPVLAWKGAVFVGQHRLALARNDAKLAPLVAELRSTTSRLSALLYAVPDSGQRELLQRQLRELAERKQQLEIELARLSAAFRQSQKLRQLTPRELVQALPADAALVDFLEVRWQENRLLAFVLRANSKAIAINDLGPSTVIADAIEQWRQTVAERSRPVLGPDDPALKLRQLLWEPIENDLQGAKTVLISPDGPVNRLPLGALPGSKPDTFLIEEIALAIIPVPQLLPELLQGRTNEGKPSLLVVGDVDYGAEPGRAEPGQTRSNGSVPEAGGQVRWQWQALPASGAEALATRDLFRQRFPEGTATVLRGKEATEAAIGQQGSRHRFLHLASHGFFADPKIRSALMPVTLPIDSDRIGREDVLGYHPGLLSGLVLAGANRPVQPDQDDGILTASEVTQLDLRGVDLAVLSACETGLGKVAGGEGVFGLQRAFQVAGARTVMTSLWKVDDEATAALMALFYHKLWQEQKPVLTALREAQLTLYHHPERIPLLAKERGPNFEKIVKLPTSQQAPAAGGKSAVTLWAGFVLSGDWR